MGLLQLGFLFLSLGCTYVEGLGSVSEKEGGQILGKINQRIGSHNKNIRQ